MLSGACCSDTDMVVLFQGGKRGSRKYIFCLLGSDTNLKKEKLDRLTLSIATLNGAFFSLFIYYLIKVTADDLPSSIANVVDDYPRIIHFFYVRDVGV